ECAFPCILPYPYCMAVSDSSSTQDKAKSALTLDYLEDAVQAFGQLLVSRGLRVCCAESCTGGLLAGALTSVAGSSDWFDQGFVTYTNQAKIDVLNVSPDTLAHHGAVSEETAMEM